MINRTPLTADEQRYIAYNLRDLYALLSNFGRAMLEIMRMNNAKISVEIGKRIAEVGQACNTFLQDFDAHFGPIDGSPLPSTPKDMPKNNPN